MDKWIRGCKDMVTVTPHADTTNLQTHFAPTQIDPPQAGTAFPDYESSGENIALEIGIPSEAFAIVLEQAKQLVPI